jgi:serine/threonine protein kinase
MNLLTSSSIRPGDLLDHYLLEDRVATGGMASIFRATDTKTGRRVAIKVPHPEKLRDPFALDRLRHETEIGEKLDHPGLVKVLPNNDAGHRYVVMEWVEGRLLREIIDERTLPSDRAIRIALSICDALEYVHGRGVVHGDLKPDNVMVDVADNVRLIDFGIARKNGLNLWNLARPKEAMGTPDYASPEQIQGKKSDVRSDVYSLGIMLFEMLTGEVPFSGLDPVTAMNLRVLSDAPAVGEINPEISLKLQAVVGRALARDRARRYASVRQIASNLAELLAEERQAQPLESFANV